MKINDINRIYAVLDLPTNWRSAFEEMVLHRWLLSSIVMAAASQHASDTPWTYPTLTGTPFQMSSSGHLVNRNSYIIQGGSSGREPGLG